MSSEKTPQSSAKLKILFTVVAVILIFILLECGARIYLRSATKGSFGVSMNEYAQTPLVPDKKLGWKWGGKLLFRGESPPSYEKADGEYRIITAGDSCCWGALIKTDQTFSANLEKLLKKHYPEKNIRVLNAGVPGYSIQQSFTIVRDILPAFDPDMIIHYGTGGAGMKNASSNSESSTSTRYGSSFLFHSKAYLLMRHLMYPLPHPRFEETSVSYGETKGLYDFLNANRIRLLFVEYTVTPDMKKLLPEFMPKPEPNKLPVAFTHRPLIDSGLPLDDLFLDQVHPTPEGHKIIAQAIFDKVVELGWLE